MKTDEKIPDTKQSVTSEILSAKDAGIVQDVLMEVLDVKREQITPESRIMEDLGADSLDWVEIAMQLEEKFGISIPDEEMDEPSTVEALYTTVAEFVRQ